MRHRGRARSLSARGRCADTTRPLHAETPTGTASGSSIPLAWPDILSARPDCADPALRCPRKRGHSNVHPHAELPTAVDIPVLPLALLTLIAFSMPPPSGTFAPPPGQAWTMFKAPQ